MATTPNYDINYDDKRFTDVESDKTEALSELEKTYGGMIANSDKYYQDQINASKQWANKQTQLQNQQTDFAIQKIEQEKAQAEKDYTKEQSGAYVDWQKQSNQYGANAEQMAAQGLANTGYSESSQVAMYTAYQNRVATARQAFEITKMNFANAIKEAQLQNSSILAEIAYKAQQEQLELALAGFQYKNQLIIEKSNKKTEIDNTYYGRYQDVLAQINEENKIAETVRQANMDEEYRRAQLAQQKEIAEAQIKEEQRQFNVLHSSSGGSGGGGTIKKSSGGSSGSSKKSSSSNSGITKAVQKSGGSVNSKANTKVDMNSVIALGKGPISARTLDNLVRSGQVIEYTENGQLKYKKAPLKTNKTKGKNTFVSGYMPKTGKSSGGAGLSATKRLVKD